MGKKSLHSNTSAHSLSTTISSSDLCDPVEGLVLSDVSQEELDRAHSALVNVLRSFQPRSSNVLARDMSSTVKDALILLLESPVLMVQAIQLMKQAKSKDAALDPQVLRDRYLESLLNNKETTGLVLDKIIELSHPGKLEMKEVMREFLRWLLISFGHDPAEATIFSTSALTKRFEDGAGVAGIAITGWGKRKFPAWKKLVVSNCTVVYSLFREIYRQFAQTFFSGTNLWLRRLPNPDYYGRLAEVCFGALLGKFKTTTQQRKDFIQFVWASEFNESKPIASSGMEKCFLKYFKKLEGFHNRDKYLPGINFTLAFGKAKTPSETRGSSSRLLASSSGSGQLPLSAKEYKSSSRKKSPFRLIFAAPSVSLCSALHSEFFREWNVRVVGDIMDISEIREDGADPSKWSSPDCIVLFGNCFGLPDPSDDVLNGPMLAKIASTIKKSHNGELPLFTSILVEDDMHDQTATGNCGVYKFACYSAVTRGTKTYGDSYSPAWSALSCIKNHNRTSPKRKIDLVVFSETGTREENYQTSAAQMYQAWKRLHTRAPKNWDQALVLEESLVECECSSEAWEKQRRHKLIDLVMSGELSKRGNSDPLELSLLTELICDEASDMDLVSKCATFLAVSLFQPHGIDTLVAEGIKIVYESGALQLMLQLVTEGKLFVHNEVIRSQITLGEVMAQGASGRVCKGEVVLDHEPVDVAVKIMSEEMAACWDPLEFKREIAVMMLLRHENLIRCFGAVTEKREAWILTEWIEGGSLRNLFSREGIQFDFPLIISLSLQISRAVAFLHSFGLIHRDLKSDNILCDYSMCIKLIDFACTRLIEPSASKGKAPMTGMIGTGPWIAPEIFKGQNYSQQADVYSLGMVMWEIIAREIPFSNIQQWNIPVTVCQGTRPQIPESSPTPFSKLIKSCWQRNQKDRPTSQEVVSSLVSMSENYHIYL